MHSRGRPLDRRRSSTWRELGHFLARAVQLAVFLYAALCFPKTGEAIPSVGQTAYINLFALPLEDVLNIRVTSDAWDGELRSGNFFLDSETIEDMRIKQGVSRQIESLLRDRRSTLIIDGYHVGLISADDLSAYLSFYQHRLRRIDLFLGDSARYLSSGGSEVVISFVTDGEPKPDAGSEVPGTEAHLS